MNGPEMELFEGKEYYFVKNCKVLTETRGEVTYEADIHGDITFLENYLSNDMGKKVKLVQKQKNSSQ